MGIDKYAYKIMGKSKLSIVLPQRIVDNIFYYGQLILKNDGTPWPHLESNRQTVNRVVIVIGKVVSRPQK